MLQRLKSRKFLVTLVVSVLLLVAAQLGLDLDANTVWALVATVTGYNLGQGAVDAAGALKGAR